MKSLFAIAVLSFALSSCSSSAPVAGGGQKESQPSATAVEKASPAAAKSAPAVKPMKCTYDTDCMVQNSCVNEKCKLTGTECRFRSDCPSPRGTCINKVCEFR